MADKNFELEIMTPFKTAFKGEVEYLVATGADGLFGVLVNHASMISGLGFGPLYVRMAGGQDKWFVVSDGFFEIHSNKSAVLVDTAEDKEEIDAARAEEAKKRAMDRLSKRESDTDFDRARAALHRALTRLQTANR